jgi:hypothetical protein
MPSLRPYLRRPTPNPVTPERATSPRMKLPEAIIGPANRAPSYIPPCWRKEWAQIAARLLRARPNISRADLERETTRALVSAGPGENLGQLPPTGAPP